MNLVHVSSSTEGFYVIRDNSTGKAEDIVSGPHNSKISAQKVADRANDSVLLSEFSGCNDAWSDMLEDIKTRHLLPLATSDLASRADFDTLDYIVCKMREMVATHKRLLDARIAGE